MADKCIELNKTTNGGVFSYWTFDSVYQSKAILSSFRFICVVFKKKYPYITLLVAFSIDKHKILS